MIGSVTVVPAVLAALGDKVDKGRIPFLHRLRRDDGESRALGLGPRHASCAARWSRPSPPARLLVALAIPALGMHTAQHRHRRPARASSRSCRSTTACRRRSRATRSRRASSSTAKDVTSAQVDGRDPRPERSTPIATGHDPRAGQRHGQPRPHGARSSIADPGQRRRRRVGARAGEAARQRHPARPSASVDGTEAT